MASALKDDVKPLLEVRDLRIAFSGNEAVRGISFAIHRGETLGLVGESGSGKSATSLAMLRLLPASASISGSIRLDGEELLTLPEAQMRARRGRSMAMIFQEPMTALNPVMTVGRQIAEAVLAHAPKISRKEVRERVLQAMHEVSLPEPQRRMDDYPHQFSGGQRQRVLIAMALVNKHTGVRPCTCCMISIIQMAYSWQGSIIRYDCDMMRPRDFYRAIAKRLQAAWYWST